MITEFDVTTLRRLSELQKRLNTAESRLRSLAGKLRNRVPAPTATEPTSAQPAVAGNPIEQELFEALARDLQPPSRQALIELEQKLRKQALAHLQKTKVDPQLWKDLASS